MRFRGQPVRNDRGLLPHAPFPTPPPGDLALDGEATAFAIDLLGWRPLLDSEGCEWVGDGWEWNPSTRTWFRIAEGCVQVAWICRRGAGAAAATSVP